MGVNGVVTNRDLDTLGRLVELPPHAPVPGQGSCRALMPEEAAWRVLCAAVLLDAWHGLFRPCPGRRLGATRRAVLAWFNEPDAAVAINLRDVCDALSLGNERDVGRCGQIVRAQHVNYSTHRKES